MEIKICFNGMFFFFLSLSSYCSLLLRHGMAGQIKGHRTGISGAWQCFWWLMSTGYTSRQMQLPKYHVYWFIRQLSQILDSDWPFAAFSCQIFLNNDHWPGQHCITDHTIFIINLIFHVPCPWILLIWKQPCNQWVNIQPVDHSLKIKPDWLIGTPTRSFGLTVCNSLQIWNMLNH